MSNKHLPFGCGRRPRQVIRVLFSLLFRAGCAQNLPGALQGGVDIAADVLAAHPLQQLLQRLADASVALGLLAVGAALRWGSTGGRLVGSLWIVVVKLMLMPAVAWWLAPRLGLAGVQRDIVVMFAALPSASSAYILAMRMGGDGKGVAWLISATTLGAVLSMWLWLTALAPG